MRDVIPAPVTGLDLSREYGHHQSPAIRAGGLIFSSGMVAINPATWEPAHGTVAAQTRQILTNMAELLEAASSSLGKVFKVGVLIYSMLEHEFSPAKAHPERATWRSFGGVAAWI